MNRSFNHFPWFLIVTLASFAACGDLFVQKLCDYSPEQPQCQDMSSTPTSIMSDGMPPVTGDMAVPRIMKNQVGFSLVAESPLGSTRHWAGVRPGGQLAFVEQNGTDGNIKRLALESNRATATGWELTDAKPETCLNCLSSITGFNLGRDYLVGANSLFFIVRTDIGGYIESYQDNNILNKTHQSGDFLDYRPFSHPNMDILLYQRLLIKDAGMNTSISTTGLLFFNSSNNSVPAEKLFANRVDRTISPAYTSLTIGNLYENNQTFEHNQVYIFQDNKLAGAYQITGNLINSNPDRLLTDSINNYMASDSDKMNKIRGVFIADLNNDGYMELIYGRGNNIHIGTYDPVQLPPILRWKNSINVSARVDGKGMDTTDRPLSISAADLNNDKFLDLAVEIVDGSPPDYRIEAKRRVSVYLNNGK